jgi:hypothetical protein
MSGISEVTRFKTILERFRLISVIVAGARAARKKIIRPTALRKAAVLAEFRTGAVSVEQACRRYEISGEEFLSWLRAFEAHGVPGLRTTRIQAYRPRRPSRGRGRRS